MKEMRFSVSEVIDNSLFERVEDILAQVAMRVFCTAEPVVIG